MIQKIADGFPALHPVLVRKARGIPRKDNRRFYRLRFCVQVIPASAVLPVLRLLFNETMPLQPPDAALHRCDTQPTPGGGLWIGRKTNATTGAAS